MSPCVAYQLVSLFSQRRYPLGVVNWLTTVHYFLRDSVARTNHFKVAWRVSVRGSDFWIRRDGAHATLFESLSLEVLFANVPFWHKILAYSIFGKR